MTTILVSALITHDDRAILVRSQNGDWELPTVPLAADEETEDALARLLRSELAFDSWTEDFLDTVYENMDGALLVRNVYLVETATEPARALLPSQYAELRWVARQDLDEIAAGEALRALLRQGIAAASGVTVPPGAPVFIITGPPGAGKSTEARLLCAHFDKSAHIEVDQLRDMVLSGIASPIPSVSDPVAAAEQIELAMANAVALARNFSLAGFHAVIDDVLETPEVLDFLLEGLSGVAEVYFVTLLPDEETLRRRDESRAAELRMGARCQDVRRIMAGNGEDRGLRLDSSGMTAEATAAQILAQRGRARVL
jgi:chloramphenicol 3-O-phosphotransferase